MNTKILKGIALYTLVVFGILIVIAGLLIGCMFLMPGFKLFGWALLAKNQENKQILSPYVEDARIKKNQTYTVVLNSSLYNTTISLRTDNDTQQVLVNQTNDMYGFYKPSEYSAADYNTTIEIDNNNNKIIINAPDFGPAIAKRASALKVALPMNNNRYHLDVTSTSGNIFISGTTIKNDLVEFPLENLTINTISGDVSFKDLENETYYHVYFDEKDRNYDGAVDSRDDLNGDGLINDKDDLDHLDKNYDGVINSNDDLNLDGKIYYDSSKYYDLATKTFIVANIGTTDLDAINLDFNQDGKVTSSDDLNSDSIINMTDYDELSGVALTNYRLKMEQVGFDIDSKTFESRKNRVDRNGNGKLDNNDKEGTYEGNVKVGEGANVNCIYRIIPFKKVLINSKKGDVSFRLVGETLPAKNVRVVSTTINQVKSAINSGIASVNALYENNNYENSMILNVERGDVVIDQVYTKEFAVNGKDVLLRANKIRTNSEFEFTSPSGLFEIGTLQSAMNTIITNNISINLGDITGEISISTTYGNIEIAKTTANASLSSVHGNIKVGEAEGSISCVTEYGDITVDYEGRAYFKNNHGKTKVKFIQVPGTAIDDVSCNKTCDIITGDGSVEALNLVYETTITSNRGGRVTAQFSELYTLKGEAVKDDIPQYLQHKIVLNGGGNATVKVPSLKAFLFKGTGAIEGQVGSATMSATSGFVPVLTEAEITDPNASTLAHLEAIATNGKITFETFWNE